MNKQPVLGLRERYLYDVDFDNVSFGSDDPDEQIYDEIVYYDGGGVEGYGDQKD